MFEKISKKWNTSWSLVKTSWFYISRDGELLLYGILSFFLSSIIPLGFLVALILSGAINETTLKQLETTEGQIIFFGIIFIYYLIWGVIKYFFQAAIMTSVERRLEGKDNSFGDGISSACARFKKIFLWSLLESVVYTIIAFIRKRFGENGAIGKLIGNVLESLLGAFWEISTYFSFPILILTSKGIKESINDSGKLFTKTWWERAIIAVGVGFVFFVIAFPIVLLGTFASFVFFSNQSIVLGISFFLLTIFAVQIFSIIASVCESIIKVLLFVLRCLRKNARKTRNRRHRLAPWR